MSHQAFVDFYQNFLSSPEGEALRARMEAITDADEFCASVAAAGRASGYEFSEDEVRQVMQASEAKMARDVAAAVDQHEGPRLAEQLQDVAGGATYSFSGIPTVDIRLTPKFMDSSQFEYSTVMCPW